MWFAIIASTLIVFLAGLLYLSFRAANFRFLKKLTGRRWLRRVLCFAGFSALTALLWLLWNMMNAVVCVIHLVVFWLICDLVSRIVSGIRRVRPERYYAGAAAVVLCALYLSAGWYCAHHVFETDYVFESPKIREDLRIVQITDVHLGTTFHAEGFLSHIGRINALSPDAVVVTGDFVDDDTSREDMLAGCDALGQFQAKYGVFFVYGNHDRGYYSELRRGWFSSELREALHRNGVVILEDETVRIGGICITGRKDRSFRGRQTAQQVMSGADPDLYTVLLDHQPYDFDAEAQAGADLVLCGHTHGGQFIPINHVGEWIGENCLAYGHERRLDTDFIVSSGISNWAFKFKTGCFSEFVVIDLKKAPVT